MTKKRYAIAHDYPLQVPAPDGVDGAISAVMAKHEAELDEALAPFGVALRDLLQPTWMRAVYVDEVEAYGVAPAARATNSVVEGQVFEGDGSGVVRGSLLVEGELTYASPSEAVAAQLNAAALAGGGSVEVVGCCGVNAACSSPTCTGTPAPGGAEDVAPPLLLEDAKVDLLGALRRSIDQARAFQAEADANGYGRPVAKAEPNDV